MNILKKTAILFISGTLIFGSVGVGFAEKGQNAAGNDQELSIKWLDINGTGLELNSNWQQKSRYITVPVNKFNETGKSGSVIVDMEKETVTGPIYYDYVGSVSEGLADVSNYKTIPYEDGGYTVEDTKSGYIDVNGNEVIAPQYERANPFHEGYAIVTKCMPVGEDYAAELGRDSGLWEKYGIIDKKGNLVIDFNYDSIAYMGEGTYTASYRNGQKDENGISKFTNGILRTDGTFQEIDCDYLMNNGSYIVVEKDNKTAYYNLKGEMVVPYSVNPGIFSEISDDLIPFLNEARKYGFYDIKEQKVIIEPEYSYALSEGFKEGLAGVGYESTNSGESWWRKMGFIDKSGKVVIPLQYEYANSFSEGVATVAVEQKENGVNAGYGAIDKEGNEVLPLKFSSVGYCQDGMMPVGWQNSAYGFYNKDGKKITPYKYSYISDAYEGLRIVSTNLNQEDVAGATEQDRLYGAVNRFGNEVIPMKYSGLTVYYDGKALIGEGFNHSKRYQTSDRIGIIQRPETADYDTGQIAFITVLVDGKAVDFDQDPLMVNDRTLVPMRMIFEAMDAEVIWNNDNWTVTAKKGDKTIELGIGQKYAYVNGEKIDLDAEARISGGRTLVPTRFIAESLDAKVEWDPATQTVSITTK